MKAHDKLFVYGTLRFGGGNSRLVLRHDAPYLERDVILPGANIYDLGSFPGLKLTPDRSSEVVGDLVEITSEDMVRDLDFLEGHPSFFKRVYLEDYDLWVYTYQDPVEESDLIESGNWFDR